MESDQKANLCIIGAAKAGTTSLFDTLITSPDISGSREKEIRYFNVNLSKGVDWYHAHFKFSDRKYYLEATPEYSMRPQHSHVPAAMASYNPDFKLIFCARDPIARMLSQINHHREQFPETFPSDSACVRTLLGFQNFVTRSFYDFSIAPFIKTFGRDQIHVFDLEDANNIKKISAFLGTDVGPLKHSNIRDEKTASYEDVVRILKDAGYYELLEHDVEQFCERFNVGEGWIINRQSD